MRLPSVPPRKTEICGPVVQIDGTDSGSASRFDPLLIGPLTDESYHVTIGAGGPLGGAGAATSFSSTNGNLYFQGGWGGGGCVGNSPFWGGQPVCPGQNARSLRWRGSETSDVAAKAETAVTA
jgi:hypothetical protein